MRLIWIFVALAAIGAPGATLAYTKTIICDGCGEVEYTKTALRSADGADNILVMDAANVQLRKYRVSQSGDLEMKRYRRTVSRVEPNQKEWSHFEEMVRLYDQVRFFLDSCGPGGVGDYLVPDMNVAWACEQHDACYAAGGNSSDRAQCDRNLYNDMIALGAPSSLATTYFLAVRTAGWLYFNYVSTSTFSSWGFQSGCAYLEVCDYTDEVEMPR